jgi:hypothetical protein
MSLPTQERESLIKKIQFILFDEYDKSLSSLTKLYTSGYYNKMTDDELVQYYHELRESNSSSVYS